MSDVIMLLCNRMFCCIFGWFFILKLGRNKEIILLSSFSCLLLWKTGRLPGKKLYKMKQTQNETNSFKIVNKVVHEILWWWVKQGLKVIYRWFLNSFSSSSQYFLSWTFQHFVMIIFYLVPNILIALYLK